MPEPTAPREPEAVRAGLIAAVAIALLAVVALTMVTAWLLWSRWTPERGAEGPGTRFDFRIAGPTLQSAPQPDRIAYMAEKDSLLRSWSWVDRDRGIARIPVEQAMQLLAQRAASASRQTGPVGAASATRPPVAPRPQTSGGPRIALPQAGALRPGSGREGNEK